MSAFQCSNKTINLLVLASNAPDFHCWWHAGDKRMNLDQQERGELLADENARSVAHRYGNGSETAEFTLEDVGPLPSPVAMLKLCDCYDYQACETDDYRNTAAAALIAAIRIDQIKRLPGYATAPWDV